MVNRLKDLVRERHLAPGDRLPAERELARELGVSRPTLREALRTLSLLGVLETRRGSGTSVSDTGANVLKAPFEFLLLLERPALYDLYEVRELLEVHLAGRAAERRTEADLAALDAALAAMRAALASGDTAAVTAPNVAFHEAVAAAAHLPLLERIQNSLRDGVYACIEATRPAVRDWEASYNVHARIVDAIRRGSATDARRAMTVHMAMALEELSRSEEEERE